MTLRGGGVSQAPWSNWNLGDHVGDNPVHVARNRALLAERLGAKPVFLKQVHGVQIACLHEGSQDSEVADACITEHTGLACTMMVADCLPVLFATTDGKCVGAAHAGWRGLAAGVLAQTVRAMQAAPSQVNKAMELLVWLGPCIGPLAFEVGDDVRQAFVSQDAAALRCFAAANGKWMADLPGLARLALVQAGIAEGNIYGNDASPAWCTVSQSAQYFSHRRDAVRLGNTGRMAASIWLA